MSALPPKADMCGALAYVCFVPKADIRETTCIKQKDRLAAVSPKFTPIFLIDQATAADFRFLRQPSRPNAPRPVANSGRVAGKGVAVTPSSEKAALNVGGVVPPTMSVPMRDQSGSSAASRIQLCKSVKPAGNEGFGRSPDSQKNSPPLTCTWGTKK